MNEKQKTIRKGGEMEIILTDEREICWKFYLIEDMNLTEILECIKQQFYSLQEGKL